jgi:hypothetical protein
MYDNNSNNNSSDIVVSYIALHLISEGAKVWLPADAKALFETRREYEGEMPQGFVGKNSSRSYQIGYPSYICIVH